VRKIYIPAEIRNECLPIERQKRYRLSHIYRSVHQKKQQPSNVFLLVCTLGCVVFREPYLHREPEFSVTSVVDTAHVRVTAVLEMHLTGSSFSQDCDLSSALMFSPSSGKSVNNYGSIYLYFSQVTDGRTDTRHCIGGYNNRHL
jgi:hypothetical protein